jgi:small subunit ribosomal protein S16
MQRTGRKGHAMFRVIVQDSHRSPTSGKVVAFLGSYDPHTKAIVLDKEKAEFYLGHGAQPSDRVAGLLKTEKVKLPDWVTPAGKKERTVRNAEKRRSTAPEKPAEEAPSEAPAESPAEPATDTSAEEATAETATEPADDTLAEPEAAEAEAEPVSAEPADDAPAETPEA